MKARAIILGLAGAALACGYSFFNDRVLKQTYLVGNFMPPFLFGTLFLFSAFINPLLKKWRLGAAEMAVILALSLVPCAIPESGFLRTFSSAVLLPEHYVKTRAAWRRLEVMRFMPPEMVPDLHAEPDDPDFEDRALNGFIQGLAVGNEHPAISEIPWKAWTRPLLFWFPILLCMNFTCIALSVILQRQWSQHELLQYPIALYAEAFIAKDKDSVLHKPSFWYSLLAILIVYTNNYLCLWFPEYIIPVQLRLRLYGFAKIFPTIVKGGGWSLFWPSLQFSMIGFAYLIPGEVSLAFGLGPWLWALFSGYLIKYGINLNKIVEGSVAHISPRPRMAMSAGSSFAFIGFMLYTGRHYYTKVFQAAFGRKSPEVGPEGAWAMRAFLLFLGAFLWQLVYRVGLDWQLAVLYTIIALVLMVTMSRVICEGGLFHFQLPIFPCIIIWQFLGLANLGPQMLLLLQMVTIVILVDPREVMMPYAMTALKLTEHQKQGIGKPAIWTGIALSLGLAIAFPITLYIQYDNGFATGDYWANVSVPVMIMDNAVTTVTKLQAQGNLEHAMTISGWERFAHLQPDQLCLWSFIIGAVLMFLIYFAKLRYTWWPLSPLLMLTWNTTHLPQFAGSFLIGWFLKKIVLRFGGSKVFNSLKPIAIGIITGELLGAMFPALIALVYYLITGETPKAFYVFMN